MADKTLEEINSDILHRAGRINPFERVKKADVEQIVNSLTSLDNDLWGREWGKYGAKYEALGDEEEKSGRKKEAGETYYLAYEYYRIGRYPVPSSPEKMTCYRGALRTFLKAAPTMDPPLKRIEIPFEGKKVVGYLQIPPGVSRPPVVMHWGGVDGWKEDRRTNNDVLLAMGLACFTIDMPGAGENPCLGNDLRAERTFSAAMDYLERGATSTASASPAWAAASAATGRPSWPHRTGAAARRRQLGRRRAPHVSRGVAASGVDLDRIAVSDGASELIGCALVHFRREDAGGGAQDRADAVLGGARFDRSRPCAPLLCINGKEDDQHPISDLYLLAEHGSPKELRIMAGAGHMGRVKGQSNDAAVDVVTKWLKDKLT